MGLWGRRGGKPRTRDKVRASRSSSYSDDYRITPELTPPDTHKHGGRADIQCCWQDGDCCPERGPCCSQDKRCLEPARPKRSPKRGRSTSAGSRMSSFGGVEVVVVNDRHVDLRRTPSCTSCESCDTCRWTSSGSITRIPLKNNLFTSPLLAHQDRSPSPPKGQAGRRYSNKVNVDQPEASPKGQGWRQAGGSPSRRKVSRNSTSSVTSAQESDNSRDTNQKRLSRRDTHRLAQQHRQSSGVTAGDAKSRRAAQSDPDPAPSHSSHRSPEDEDDVGDASKKTEGGGGGGGRGKPSGKTNAAGRKRSSTTTTTTPAAPTATTKATASLTLSKRDLLNQMVNQTKQHRQQIRCLESELERLRSGDVLSRCEVNATDVEWRPGNVVGEGSFSTVYRGSYCGIDVAVKELKFKLSQDDKNYFRSEAALLQQLHHPRVVLLMGVCTTAARPFMVLEYLSGGTLHSLVHDPTRESLDHAAYFAVARDVAQGMNYLHRHEPQVLHLDLKSMNVLLDAYFRAKIADFGFSILRRSRSGSPAQRGSIRGTPAWMAPELLTKGDVSTKCDVYSYAIILWEMLSSSHPFKGLDIFQIMETIEAGGRPPLPSGGVSPELRELITSCWAQNPSLRPSFEEILGALDAAAIPGSWRGVLQKANVTPRLLSDVAATRTIIGVVEESVELVRRSLQQQRASAAHKALYDRHTTDNNDDKTSKLPREFVAGSSPSRRPSPRRQVEAKRAPSRVSGPSRGLQNKIALRDSDQQYSQDKTALQRRNGSDRIDRNRTTYNESVDRWAQRGQSRERGVRRTDSRHNRQDRKTEVADKDERRGRDRVKKYGRYKDRDIHHELGRGGQKGLSQSRRPPRTMVEPQNREKRATSLEVYRHRDIRRSSSRDHQSRNNEHHRFSSSDRHANLRRDTRYRNLHHIERESSGEDRCHDHEHLGDSQDSLVRESCTESWASTEGNSRHSSHIAQEKIGDSRLITRRYSPSPRRRSPDRRYSSPTRAPDYHRRRSPERRHPSHSPQRRMQTPETRRSESSSRLGLMVTSEQLMSQKQRLRPVRPAALSDLSNIPEHSLNDISLILKTAMTKRRDAFDEELSGRDTFHSEDLDWSDWH